MKEQNTNIKKSFIRKLLIKIIRKLGFEAIDQQNYTLLGTGKNLGEQHSIPGLKSLVIPFGELKINKAITDIKIIFRSCTATNIMDQNKERLFESEKKEYTFRSLNSILKSIQRAKKIFLKTNFSLVVTDAGSGEDDLRFIKKILDKYSDISSTIIVIDPEDFKNKIKGEYSNAKFSNMANFYTSLNIAKNDSEDLIYFVEDDYVHKEIAIEEMLLTYEKFRTIFEDELILLPADYPYLYTKNESTNILYGEKRHWRQVNESLVTFMTSKKIILEYWNELTGMASHWSDPWEKPLHDIYENKKCFSPIPSLSMHCANIKSVFGLPPNYEWKENWDENKIEF
jgi:hypothetical protein|tara:strand:+ start:129 stop:1151 length:1023 start_codon:yes stop_codon:yes gene_type:complete